MRVALMFPGQGAQYVGMGHALAAQYPVAAEIFARADEALKIPLSKICFEGPAEELVKTQNNQPALLATSMACWEVLRQEGPVLDVTGAAGLSLGEYSALVMAEALSLEDALRLVRARGSFMQEACEAVPSGMASVMGMQEEALRALAAEVAGNEGMVLDIANVNSPGQIVLSGHKGAVAKALTRIETMEGIRAVALNVSGAFHSALMQSAADKLAEVIGSVAFRTPKVPVYGNVTGEALAEASLIPGLLLRQITSSVRWEACMRSMLAGTPDLLIELGSGRVLSGLLRKIDRKAKSCNIEDPPSLQKALGAMVGQGEAKR